MAVFYWLCSLIFLIPLRLGLCHFLEKRGQFLEMVAIYKTFHYAVVACRIGAVWALNSTRSPRLRAHRPTDQAKERVSPPRKEGRKARGINCLFNDSLLTFGQERKEGKEICQKKWAGWDLVMWKHPPGFRIIGKKFHLAGYCILLSLARPSISIGVMLRRIIAARGDELILMRLCIVVFTARSSKHLSRC